MKKALAGIPILLAWTAVHVHAQTQVDLRSQSKSVDFTGAVATKPFKSGTVLPAVCSVGEAFFKTSAPAGQNWYGCTAPNVWALEGNGAGGSGGPIASLQLTDFSMSIANPLQVTVQSGTYRIGNMTFTVPPTSFTIQHPVIASIASAGSATTVALQTAANFRTGDLVNIQGATGCPGLNGVWVTTGVDMLHFQIPFNSSSCTYTASSATAGANSNATGSVYLYGSSTGEMTMEHPSGAGLLVSCAGVCVTRQVASPSFQAGSVPLASLTLSQGVWNSLADARAFLSNLDFVDGTGIATSVFGGIRVLAVDASVARTSIPNTWTGDNDFSSAPSVTIRRGSGVPTSGSCSGAAHVGRLYERADSQVTNASLYVCSQTGRGEFAWELAQIGAGLAAPADGGLQVLTASQPSCDASHRGTFFYVAGASGVKDNVQVCAKDSSDNFAWRTIF